MYLQISDGLLVFLGIGIFIAGAALWGYYTSKRQRIMNTVKKYAPQSVNSAQNNSIIRLEGHAKFVDTPFKAPFSGRECIYYEARVEEKVKNGWRSVAHEIRRQDFFLKVNSDMALIKDDDPIYNIKLLLVEDHQERSGFGNDAKVHLEHFLERHGTSSTTFFDLMNRTLRYSEGVIELDELITVLGTARWKSLSEPIEGFPYSKILTLESSKEQKLIVTDDPAIRQLKKSKEKSRLS